MGQLALEAVMAKLADSTRRVYASGWKQWVLYNSGSRAPLFLDGEERSARQERRAKTHQVRGVFTSGHEKVSWGNPVKDYLPSDMRTFHRVFQTL